MPLRQHRIPAAHFDSLFLLLTPILEHRRPHTTSSTNRRPPTSSFSSSI
ncbi:putative tubulin beta-5 chain [Iris pallida]|uniref:Tubulin beta-5 chain n=1 Tax=Iris pallida TaxID=29817 RepID=A0AAX6H3C7_IRIPA|nr:putative tubulin beta-5 chain [Iris pallida]